MDEVSGIGAPTEAVYALDTSEGFVFIERVGSKFALRRFEVGGRREGEVLRDKERPIGVLRVGGRKEGSEAPFVDIIDGLKIIYSFIHSFFTGTERWDRCYNSDEREGWLVAEDGLGVVSLNFRLRISSAGGYFRAQGPPQM